MGFGLLFIGYMFMYSFPYNGFDVLPDLIGFIISFIGVRSLSEYGCGWDILKKYFYLVLPASGITLLYQLFGLFHNNVFGDEIWYYAYTAILLVYNILLLIAVYKIADDTDVKSVKAKAHRNMIIGIIYYSIMLILEFPIRYIQELKFFLSEHYALGFVLYILGYLWQFLNLCLVFSCYMWICKEGDQDMPEKERKLFKNKQKREEE